MSFSEDIDYAQAYMKASTDMMDQLQIQCREAAKAHRDAQERLEQSLRAFETRDRMTQASLKKLGDSLKDTRARLRDAEGEIAVLKSHQLLPSPGVTLTNGIHQPMADNQPTHTEAPRGHEDEEHDDKEDVDEEEDRDEGLKKTYSDLDLGAAEGTPILHLPSEVSVDIMPLQLHLEDTPTNGLSDEDAADSGHRVAQQEEGTSGGGISSSCEETNARSSGKKGDIVQRVLPEQQSSNPPLDPAGRREMLKEGGGSDGHGGRIQYAVDEDMQPAESPNAAAGGDAAIGERDEAVVNTAQLYPLTSRGIREATTKGLMDVKVSEPPLRTSAAVAHLLTNRAEVVVIETSSEEDEESDHSGDESRGIMNTKQVNECNVAMGAAASIDEAGRDERGERQTVMVYVKDTDFEGTFSIESFCLADGKEQRSLPWIRCKGHLLPQGIILSE